MATEAQIDANRQNAQKSTGPVTAEGKTDSEKQSQLDVDPQKVIALVKETWGEDLPAWVKGGLSRLGITEKDYEAASVTEEALAKYRTQGNGGYRGAALSLASL